MAKIEEARVYLTTTSLYNYLKENNKIEEGTIYFAKRTESLTYAYVFYPDTTGPVLYKVFDPSIQSINDVLIEIFSGKEPVGGVVDKDTDTTGGINIDPSSAGGNSATGTTTTTTNSEINKILDKSSIVFRINKGTKRGADKLIYRADKIAKELNIGTDSTIKVTKEDTDKNEDTVDWQLSVSKTPGTLTVNGSKFDGSKDVELNIGENEGTYWDEF